MLRQIIVTVIVATLVITIIPGHSPLAASQAEDATITGCLQTGATEGEFTLVADDKQTYRIQPAEGVELAAHANHRVELTGTVEKSETSSVLKANTLKMVSTSCEA